ncbi:unnamed protein product, partial [Closterium sp. Yama58-4]
TAPEAMTVFQSAALPSVIHKAFYTLQIVLLRTPFYVGLTLPMASLLAPLLCLARMSSDNE